MFFCLDAKEPKNQDCQKKSGNSTANFTEILKLTTSWRFKQSEFLTFRSPEFLTIFSEGRAKKTRFLNKTPWINFIYYIDKFMKSDLFDVMKGKTVCLITIALPFRCGAYPNWVCVGPDLESFASKYVNEWVVVFLSYNYLIRKKRDDIGNLILLSGLFSSHIVSEPYQGFIELSIFYKFI